MREATYLRERYRAVISTVGVILALAGVLMLTPLLLLLTGDPALVQEVPAFLIPAGVLGVLGLSVWRLFRPRMRVSLSTQEGGVIVLLSWTIVALFSAWPFVAAHGLGFTGAVFESVSGWTTTGLSVVDVAEAGKMILLWRSTMQLAGGAGLAIIMMSAIIGPTGVGVSAAEGRVDQLVPQVRQSARLVLLIYAGYAATGTVAYILAGMSTFDAVNHSFAAVSTGGFSTYAESIGHWNSVAVEAVTVPLMVLGNLSFITAWLLLRGKLRYVTRNGEVRLFALLIPVTSAAVFLATSSGLYPQLAKSIRVAIFETITALTTTGFSTVGYGDWNSFGILVLIVLMLIGGGTCSTAGGIKQYRVFTLAKVIAWELRRPFLPGMAVVERPLWEADRKVFLDDARLRLMSAFVFLYLAMYIVGSLITAASGYSVADSLFEAASALGTVGLSVGVTAADAPKAVLWSEIVSMFLGRLELLVIFVSVFKLAKDARVMLRGANG
ncbi:MAG: TrkH family potassium uptake protein [Thermoleophilia bacterium]